MKNRLISTIILLLTLSLSSCINPVNQNHPTKSDIQQLNSIVSNIVQQEYGTYSTSISTVIAPASPGIPSQYTIEGKFLLNETNTYDWYALYRYPGTFSDDFLATLVAQSYTGGSFSSRTYYENEDGTYMPPSDDSTNILTLSAFPPTSTDVPPGLAPLFTLSLLPEDIENLSYSNTSEHSTYTFSLSEDALTSLSEKYIAHTKTENERIFRALPEDLDSSLIKAAAGEELSSLSYSSCSISITVTAENILSNFSRELTSSCQSGGTAYCKTEITAIDFLPNDFPFSLTGDLPAQ